METITDYNIAQVSLKRSDTDYEIITLNQFLKKDVKDRTEMVLKKQIQFFDYRGNQVPLLEGLKAITELIKKLRSEGKLLSDLR